MSLPDRGWAFSGEYVTKLIAEHEAKVRELEQELQSSRDNTAATIRKLAEELQDESMSHSIPCAALLRVNGSNSFRHCRRDALPGSRYCKRHQGNKR